MTAALFVPTPLTKPSRSGWLVAVMLGIAAPALALGLLADASAPGALMLIAAPILAVGLMGAAMIAAAATGRLAIGMALALTGGAGLVLLAQLRGMAALADPLALGLAAVIASLSFAARGALFARSAGDKGWWIAIFVVAGEVAILATAIALPQALPDWLLALLPAQWATSAIQTALSGTALQAASAVLVALGGTAASTLVVALLLPRRWPYVLMFTGWLACSALVWHWPAPPVPHADSDQAAVRPAD